MGLALLGHNIKSLCPSTPKLARKSLKHELWLVSAKENFGEVMRLISKRYEKLKYCVLVEVSKESVGTWSVEVRRGGTS